MSTRTPDSSSLVPAVLGKTYSSFVADLDLLADCFTLTGNKTKEPCRRIRAISAGVVACYFAGAPTTKVLITYLQGDIDDLQLVKVGGSADGTTVTGLTVYW